MESEVRAYAVALVRVRAMTAKEALRFVLQYRTDDRPLAKVDYAFRGNGNRSKRRAGWVLTRWQCHHMDGGYDCCCEPQGGWYYEEP